MKLEELKTILTFLSRVQLTGEESFVFVELINSIKKEVERLSKDTK